MSTGLSYDQPLARHRVLVVGGGGGGNGRAISRAVAAAGGRLVVADLDLERARQAADEIVHAGGDATGVGGDVSRAEDVERMVTEAVSVLGGLDVLITVVGGHSVIAPWLALHKRLMMIGTAART